MKNLEYNIGVFFDDLRKNGLKSAIAEDWKETLERGYLTKTGKAVASGAVVGIPLFGVAYGIDKGMEFVTESDLVKLAVISIPYSLASFFTIFAIGDGYEQNRIQILE